MIKQSALFVLKTYQRTRIFRSPACRFYPACSSYAAGAIEKHGLVKGLLLAVFRLLRCHPLDPGGIDEVPERFSLAFAGAPPRLHAQLVGVFLRWKRQLAARIIAETRGN